MRLRCRSRTSRLVPATTSRWMGAGRGCREELGTTRGGSVSFAIVIGTQPNFARGAVGIGDHRRCLRRLQAIVRPADQSLGRPDCVQPQLGSLLVVQLVRRRCFASIQQHGQDENYFVPTFSLAATNFTAYRPATLAYALASRHPYSLDSGQEPDLLHRSHVRRA